MKVKFLKTVRDAKEKGKFFVKGKTYNLPKARADKAIKKNLCVEEYAKSTQEKLSEKTTKK